MSLGKANSKAMYRVSIKLFFRNEAARKSEYVFISLEVYISNKGTYEKVRFPLGIKWPHKLIDRERACLEKRDKYDIDVNDYNMMIRDEIGKINEVAKLYRLSGRFLTAEDLKRELMFIDSNKSVVSYFEKRRLELYKLNQISYQTYKNYGTTIGRIKEFDPGIRFDGVNVKWMGRFKSFLKKAGNAHNTIWTRIKDVKALLRAANEEVTIFVDTAAIEYENKSVNNPIVYLTRDEIARLKQLYKSNELKTEDQSVLKAFLFSCFTSLRISDIYQANKSWMLSDNFLTFTMQKNKSKKPKTIRIPIAPMAKEFISDTLNQFFKLPTQQEYNRTLKDIAIWAGINKRLTSHVGRHTFGYLFMTSVGDIYALKEIMGHSKIETTQRYAHLDDDNKLDMVIKMQRSFI